MVRTPTRRKYLTTIGVVGIAGLAGCSDESGTTTEQATPTVDFPSLSAADPTYRKWQPGTGEMKGIITATQNTERYREHQSELPPETYESVCVSAMTYGYAGIEYEELEGSLVPLSGPGVVFVGSFARTDVESRLESMPYEQYTARNDVTYYRWDIEDTSKLIGVGNEGVIVGDHGRDEDDPVDRFVDETMVLFETARGERPRLHEENDLYRQYTESVGWPLFAAVTRPMFLGDTRNRQAQQYTDPVSDEIAASIRWNQARYLADDAIVERNWLWTIEGAPASPADVATAYRKNSVQSELTNDGQSLAVRRDGRVVDLGIVDPIENAGGGVDPVLVSLDITRDGQTVTVEHVAGDPVPLSRVTVRVDGDTVDTLTDGTLSPGSSRSFRVAEDVGSILLIYEPPHAEDTIFIAKKG